MLPLILVNNPGIYIYCDLNSNPLTADCSIDLPELTDFSAQWLNTSCDESNNFCQGGDLNHDGLVDLFDFSELARYWLLEPGGS